MSARHRRAVPPRKVTHLLVGAGVAGLASVFAVTPTAGADPAEPVTSDAPAETPAPGSDQPSAPAPDSGPATSKAALKKAPAATKADAKAKAKIAAVGPNYGTQKIRVGVQIKSGAYVPPGTTTLGSQVTIVETGPGVADGTKTTVCTTSETGPREPGSTATFCKFFSLGDRAPAPSLTIEPQPTDPAVLFQQYVIQPGDTVTLTQTTVNANLVIDPETATIPPCTNPEQSTRRVAAADDPSCDELRNQYVFDDAGLPPAAADDKAKTLVGQPVDVDVLENDSTAGAPITSFDVTTDPQHGTAEVMPAQANASQFVAYTPAAGFAGTDTFRYTFATANGTATALATITVVPPPPSATDDTASTTSGTAVTVAVTANDDANGGGALRVTAVGDPGHGTARIDGTSVRYTPNADFVGTDTFTYTVETAYGSDSATVTVTVSAPAVPEDNNDEPLADTGVASDALLEYSLAMLLAGGAATAVGRRRRPHGRHAA